MATSPGAVTTRSRVLGRNLPVLPNNHGPQTDRLVYGLGAFKGYDSRRSRRAAKSVSTTRRSSTRTSSRCRTAAAIIAGQFDDPYQLDEKGIFDLVNLSTERPRRHPRRAARSAEGRVHRLQHLLDRARSPDDGHLPATASRTTAQLNAELAPTACCASGRASAARRRRPSTPRTSSPASRAPASGCRSAATRCRCSTPASWARSVRRSICTPARCTT